MTQLIGSAFVFLLVFLLMVALLVILVVFMRSGSDGSDYDYESEFDDSDTGAQPKERKSENID